MGERNRHGRAGSKPTALHGPPHEAVPAVGHLLLLSDAVLSSRQPPPVEPGTLPLPRIPGLPQSPFHLDSPPRTPSEDRSPLQHPPERSPDIQCSATQPIHLAGPDVSGLSPALLLTASRQKKLGAEPEEQSHPAQLRPAPPSWHPDVHSDIRRCIHLPTPHLHPHLPTYPSVHPPTQFPLSVPGRQVPFQEGGCSHELCGLRGAPHSWNRHSQGQSNHQSD